MLLHEFLLLLLLYLVVVYVLRLYVVVVVLGAVLVLEVALLGWESKLGAAECCRRAEYCERLV